MNCFSVVMFMQLPDRFDWSEPAPFWSSSVDLPSIDCRIVLSAFAAHVPTSSPSLRKPERKKNCKQKL